MYNLLANADHIETYFGNNEELALETLNSFLSTVDEDIRKINNFLESSDQRLSEIYVVLHSLKPTVFYLDLATTYQKLEALVDEIRGSDDLEKGKLLIAEFSLIFKKDIKEMRTYATSLQTSKSS